MKITNRMGLPEALVRACTTDQHNEPGKYSATTLLKGAKEILLTSRHWDEIEDDVADRIFALFGSAVHFLLEHETASSVTEERFEIAIDGACVTGRIDMYDMETYEITDYKTASIWKVIHGDFEEWRKQGMIYAYLLSANGFKVKRCNFVAMLKDHSAAEAARNASYPQKPVFVYSFDVTPGDMMQTGSYLSARIGDIQMAKKLADDEIPPCTASERWATEDTYAVMKEGRKSAVKAGFASEQDAKIYAGDVEKSYIEKRPGESRKCIAYCICNKFCNFYQSIKDKE